MARRIRLITEMRDCWQQCCLLHPTRLHGYRDPSLAASNQGGCGLSNHEGASAWLCPIPDRCWRLWRNGSDPAQAAQARHTFLAQCLEARMPCCP